MKAKQLISAGKGDEKAEFMDGVNGKKGVLKTTAKIYISWYDPDGNALLPKNAAKLNNATSVMWMIGDTSSIGALGMTYAFSKAPSNPNNASWAARAPARSPPGPRACSCRSGGQVIDAGRGILGIPAACRISPIQRNL
jgi:hypothetical protein